MSAASLARIGARTIGGTAGGTLLVTALVIELVQDYGWFGPVRRTALAEHKVVDRENLKAASGQGLPFQSAYAIYYACLAPVAPPPKWSASQWMSPAPCGAGPRPRTSRSLKLPAS